MNRDITEHDIIITAYASPAQGPGYSNTPLWVVVRDRRDGAYREICLQPDEQSREMLTLYKIAAAVNEELLGWVKVQLLGGKTLG